MQKNLSKAIQHVLLMECGPNGLDDGAPHNDPDDPGGATRWGLSQRAFKGKIDVLKTTKEEAVEIYEKVYWRAIRADALPTGLDLFAFDFAVNAGTPTVNKILAERDWSVTTLAERRRVFYHTVAVRRVGAEKFLEGWLKRCDQTEHLALELERSEADATT